jgi:hypothetical protein
MTPVLPMRSRTVMITLGAAIGALTPAIRAQAPAASPYKFETQQIREGFGVGYAVTIADVNKDKKPDIVAINGTQLVWFENPSWTMHVALDGQTPKDNVTLAPHDIDRDGRLDVALGAAWNPKDTLGGGTLHWVSQGGLQQTPASKPGENWTLRDITSEPTLHRIRWANVDGTGDPELIVTPLHGKGTAPPEWNGVGPRILALTVPKDPAKDPWPVEVIDDSLHILHNFAVLDFDGDKDDELITASREGVHLFERAAAGKWTKTRIGEGPAGEIKVGRVAAGIATPRIEEHAGSVRVLASLQRVLRQVGIFRFPILRETHVPAMWDGTVLVPALDVKAKEGDERPGERVLELVDMVSERRRAPPATEGVHPPAVVRSVGVLIEAERIEHVLHQLQLHGRHKP